MDQSILDMLLLPVDKKQPSHSQCHIYHHEIQQAAACDIDIEGSATNQLMNEKMIIDTVTTRDSNVEKHYINGTGCLVISKDQHDTCSEYVFSQVQNCSQVVFLSDRKNEQKKVPSQSRF